MTATLADLIVPATHCPNCLSRRLADGKCRPCELNDSIAFPAMCDAQSRLDDGEHTTGERPELEAIVEHYWRMSERVDLDAVTAPNGCKVCGAEERGHGTWHGGGHTRADGGRYVAPPNWMRLDRMFARRVARESRCYLAVDRMWPRALKLIRNARRCPTCGGLVYGLLATCAKPRCLSFDLSRTKRMERRCDDQ